MREPPDGRSAQRLSTGGGRVRLAEASATLCDGSQGTLPGRQGWLYATDPAVGAGATQTQTANGVILDTTGAMSDSAGYFSEDPLTGGGRHPDLPTLDRAAGYSVRFTARVSAESHAGGDRAGFSLIVLSEDHMGVELGLWEDGIWAQSGPDFGHAEGAAFDTGAALIDYELRVLGGHYALWADGFSAQAILSGALRDNSSQGAALYSRTSFLFSGDNTSSAEAAVELAGISIRGW